MRAVGDGPLVRGGCGNRRTSGKLLSVEMTGAARWTTGISLALAVFLRSSTALSLCPNCLGQAPTLTPTLKLLGIFLLVPFVVTYVAARVIRRACSDLRGSGRSLQRSATQPDENWRNS
jgi:hypothetical protein